MVAEAHNGKLAGAGKKFVIFTLAPLVFSVFLQEMPSRFGAETSRDEDVQRADAACLFTGV